MSKDYFVSEILLRQAKAGNPLAMDAVLKTFQPMIGCEVASFMRRRSIEDKEDATVRCLCAAARAVSSWETGKGTKVYSYVQKCVRRELISVLRLGVQSADSLEDNDVCDEHRTPPELAVEARGGLSQFRAMLEMRADSKPLQNARYRALRAKLGGDDELIEAHLSLLRFRCAGLSYKECAAAMGTDVRTVEALARDLRGVLA